MRIENLTNEVKDKMIKYLSGYWYKGLEEAGPYKKVFIFDEANDQIEVQIIFLENNKQVLPTRIVGKISNNIKLLYIAKIISIEEVLNCCPELIQKIDKYEVLKHNLKKGNLYDYITQEGYKFSKDELIDIIKEYDYFLYSKYKNNYYIEHCEEIAEELEERGFFDSI